ncbi:NAD-dependent epimerase/dehydratase family protein [Nocardioides sp.]|uniref:NAD-dependent epimerase/dehydratase family protein n=1 Tax=Nocardioides sp. TaxID=35761 RepID=UPI00356A56F2
MRVLVVGCGLVGKELARMLRANGHVVVGTTTTPGKVGTLQDVCDEVVVLKGGDRDKVHAAAADVDAVVVLAGPAAAQAMTVEQRQRTYRSVLVDTAESVASIPGNPYIVMLSSLSVYGDAANHLDVIDESAPLTQSDDPSPAMFQEAERTYRAAAADRLAILRSADIAGGEDPPVMDKLRMAHQVLGGSVPFHDEALFYRINVLDVARAVIHMLEGRHVGTFNMTHPEVPPALQPYFDTMCALDGLPPLEYRNELRAPTKPVSVDALLATGFRLEHTEVERMPEEGAVAPPSALADVDRTGREIVTAALERIVSDLGLVEETGPDGAAALPLTGAGGPLDGKSIGAFRVFTREDGVRVVYSVLAVDDFGMDTHQIYAFTPASGAVPHLFLDTAISPNTDGTFHFGLDLVPRVDLGVSLDYSEAVYGPVAEARAEALGRPGVMPVPSIGPLQWSIRSPWMVAAIVRPEDLRGLADVVDSYVDQWVELVQKGLPESAAADAAGVDLAARDARSRAAIFSPRTNPVWGFLDRLVGADAARAMVDLLSRQS